MMAREFSLLVSVYELHAGCVGAPHRCSLSLFRARAHTHTTCRRGILSAGSKSTDRKAAPRHREDVIAVDNGCVCNGYALRLCPHRKDPSGARSGRG